MAGYAVNGITKVLSYAPALPVCSAYCLLWQFNDGDAIQHTKFSYTHKYTHKHKSAGGDANVDRNPRYFDGTILSGLGVLVCDSYSR